MTRAAGHRTDTLDHARLDRRIKNALAAGMEQKTMAEAFGVGTATLSRRIKHLRETGQIPDKTRKATP